METSKKGMVGLIVMIFLLGGLFVYDHYTLNQKLDEVTNELEEQKKAKKETKSEIEKETSEEASAAIRFTGVYSFSDQVETKTPAGNTVLNYSLQLTFYEDQTVSVHSSNGVAVIEDSKGTYDIKENKLIYTRQSGDYSKEEVGNEMIMIILDSHALRLDQAYFSNYSKEIILTKQN